MPLKTFTHIRFSSFILFSVLLTRKPQLIIFGQELCFGLAKAFYSAVVCKHTVSVRHLILFVDSILIFNKTLFKVWGKPFS